MRLSSGYGTDSFNIKFGETGSPLLMCTRFTSNLSTNFENWSITPSRSVTLLNYLWDVRLSSEER